MPSELRLQHLRRAWFRTGNSSLAVCARADGVARGAVQLEEKRRVAEEVEMARQAEQEAREEAERQRKLQEAAKAVADKQRAAEEEADRKVRSRTR